MILYDQYRQYKETTIWYLRFHCVSGLWRLFEFKALSFSNQDFMDCKPACSDYNLVEKLAYFAGMILCSNGLWIPITQTGFPQIVLQNVIC